MNIKWKQLILVFLLIAAVMLLFLAVVIIGNRVSPDRYAAAQYLTWILAFLLSFIAMPFLAYLSYTKPASASPATHWNRKDNLFFAAFCLPLAVALFLAFGDLEHHRAIERFFVGIFGRNYKGAPNFPVPLLSLLVFAVFGLGEVLHNKLRYGVYEFPDFPDPGKQKVFRRRRSIYYCIALVACIICAISYFLKWTILIE